MQDSPITLSSQITTATRWLSIHVHNTSVFNSSLQMFNDKLCHNAMDDGMHEQSYRLVESGQRLSFPREMPYSAPTGSMTAFLTWRTAPPKNIVDDQFLQPQSSSTSLLLGLPCSVHVVAEYTGYPSFLLQKDSWYSSHTKFAGLAFLGGILYPMTKLLIMMRRVLFHGLSFVIMPINPIY